MELLFMLIFTFSDVKFLFRFLGKLHSPKSAFRFTSCKVDATVMTAASAADATSENCSYVTITYFKAYFQTCPN